MEREWIIQRTTVVRSDAARRWDQAYQYLLRWAARPNGGDKREGTTDERAAIYARVSTTRQARTQKIDLQVERLKSYAERKRWTFEEEHVYLDEGYSGATLNRPA